VSFSLGADVGYLSGYSLYHITGPMDYPFISWESELEFPLDSYVGGVNASLGEESLWSIVLSLAKNLTRDTGKMKDSDWMTVGYGYTWVATGNTNTREKIIYSESDTDMDALFLDLSGRYYFLSEATDSGVIGSLGVIGGYRYQNLSFDIRVM